MDDAWKELDQVTRKWAVMSGFENDLKNYENLKEIISFEKYVFCKILSL